MRDERTGEDLVSHRLRASTSSTPTRRPRRTTCCSSSSRTRSCRASSRAASASRWGAKALPGGGWWSMPKLSMPGAVIVGDAGGHGRHGRRSRASTTRSTPGMLAAEAIYAALAPRRALASSAYEQALEDSVDRQRALPRAQHAPAVPEGLHRAAAPLVNLAIATKGRLPPGALRVAPQRRAADVRRQTRAHATPSPTASYTFDKLSSVYITRQRDARRRAQPHPRRTTASRASSPRRGAGCARPASTRSPTTRPQHGDVDVIVNYTNCVQCGAITAKGGRLTTPEGGDGPLYQISSERRRGARRSATSAVAGGVQVDAMTLTVRRLSRTPGGRRSPPLAACLRARARGRRRPAAHGRRCGSASPSPAAGPIGADARRSYSA